VFLSLLEAALFAAEGWCGECDCGVGVTIVGCGGLRNFGINCRDWRGARGDRKAGHVRTCTRVVRHGARYSRICKFRKRNHGRKWQEHDIYSDELCCTLTLSDEDIV
jgi:hypothetical protein